MSTLQDTIAPPPSSTAMAWEAARTNRVLGMQCLIVSADGRLQQQFKQVLGGAGIATRSHMAAELALEAMEHDHFDLVVVDCANADLGVAFLRSGRRTAANTRAAYLAISDATLYTRQLLDAGASMLMARPATAGRVVTVLNALLGTMLQERRRAARLPVEIPMTISVERGPFVSATAINVSCEGMAVQSPVCARPGDHLHASFALPGTRTVVEFEGTVMWSDERGRTGVQLRSVQPSVRMAFERWLHAKFEEQLAILKRELELPASVPGGSPPAPSHHGAEVEQFLKEAAWS